MEFPLGIDDFKKLRDQGCIFVDKTLLIKELLQDGTESFLITRPRRFGKTINMSMLKYFYDIQNAAENRKLFEDTLIADATYESAGKIYSCMDEQGKYPVVFLTLKKLRATSFEEMINDIRTLIAKLYRQHNYLLESDKVTDDEKDLFRQITALKSNISVLKDSIQSLTDLLQRHYGLPVILLVDEYDTPMHSAYSAPEPYHDELSTFMSTFLGEAFKGNGALKKGILTGILRVSLMNLFSGFNSVTVRSILSDRYSQRFGFTESEVSKLFKDLGREQDESTIKAWYNGYQFGGVTIYNPWSIISCLDNNDKLQAYWLETGKHGVLGKALVSSSNFDVFDQLKQLLDGRAIKVELDERTIFANIESNQRALWTLMLYSGYLTVTRQWNVEAKEYAELSIPNIEVRSGIESMVETWNQIGKNGELINNELVRALGNGDIKGFKQIVQNYILQTISYYDFNFKMEERFYHIFMLGMCLTLGDSFIIDSNKEAGLGRYDIILIPKDKKLLGVVLELKSVDLSNVEEFEVKKDELKRITLMEEAANEAVEQIKKKSYGVKFLQHDIKQFAAIGMAFLGKEVSVVHELVNIDC